MPYMLDEIHQQPDVVERLVKQQRACAQKLALEIRSKGIEFIIIAARGTSDHAAIYGKYLLEIKNAFPVALADCSIYTLYNAKLRLPNTLVIGISQSGQAPDVIEYLKKSREFGALTAAITNEPESPITEAADYSLLCEADKEHSVAATKTYTSALAALYLISAALLGDGEHIEKLLSCAEAMRSALAVDEYIKRKAERYRYMQSGYAISRGFNYCTALETALKLAETNYISVRGYSAADLMHGPIAAVHESDPCIIIAPPGKAYDTMLSTATRLKEKQAETLIISSEDEILSMATTPVKLDMTVDEDLSPLMYVIPGQLFAYHLAITRGYDPDQPRGLNKVTLTR